MDNDDKKNRYWRANKKATKANADKVSGRQIWDAGGHHDNRVKDAWNDKEEQKQAKAKWSRKMVLIPKGLEKREKVKVMKMSDLREGNRYEWEKAKKRVEQNEKEK